MGGNSDLIVSVSGFVRVCMDENGNEKMVSYVLLTLKEGSEMYIWGPCSSWLTLLLLVLVQFSFLALYPVFLRLRPLGDWGGAGRQGRHSPVNLVFCTLSPCHLDPCPSPSFYVFKRESVAW